MGEPVGDGDAEPLALPVLAGVGEAGVPDDVAGRAAGDPGEVAGPWVSGLVLAGCGAGRPGAGFGGVPDPGAAECPWAGRSRFGERTG